MGAPTSTRPYLIRAIYEWALDNGHTPHVLVDVTATGVKIPDGYAREGRITLNISPQAVNGLEIAKEWISFSARFGGRAFQVEAPVQAVLAIFARETGRGFFFQKESAEGAAPPPKPVPPASPPAKRKPKLRRVK